jgi:hypothetical protein
MDLWPACTLKDQVHSDPERHSSCLCSLALHCFPVEYFEIFQADFSSADLRWLIHHVLEVNYKQFRRVVTYFRYMKFHTSELERQTGLTCLATYYRHAVSQLMQSFLHSVVVLLVDKPELQRLLKDKKEFEMPLHGMDRILLQVIPCYTMCIVNDFLSMFRDDFGMIRLPRLPGEALDQWYLQSGIREALQLDLPRILNKLYSEAISEERLQSAVTQQIPTEHT